MSSGFGVRDRAASGVVVVDVVHVRLLSEALRNVHADVLSIGVWVERTLVSLSVTRLPAGAAKEVTLAALNFVSGK